MKKYQTIITVTAEPATKGEAKKQGLSTYKHFDCDDDTPGYIVKDDDTIGEWLPEKDFRKNYYCSETHIDRMEAEYAQLTERIIKATRYILSERGRNRGGTGLLDEQIAMMLRYASCLAERIDNAKKKEKEQTAEPADYSWLEHYELVTPAGKCDSCEKETADCRKIILADGATLCFKPKTIYEKPLNE